MLEHGLTLARHLPKTVYSCLLHKVYSRLVHKRDQLPTRGTAIHGGKPAKGLGTSLSKQVTQWHNHCIRRTQVVMFPSVEILGLESRIAKTVFGFAVKSFCDYGALHPLLNIRNTAQELPRI